MTARPSPCRRLERPHHRLGRQRQVSAGHDRRGQRAPDPRGGRIPRRDPLAERAPRAAVALRRAARHPGHRRNGGRPAGERGRDPGLRAARGLRRGQAGAHLARPRLRARDRPPERDRRLRSRAAGHGARHPDRPRRGRRTRPVSADRRADRGARARLRLEHRLPRDGAVPHDEAGRPGRLGCNPSPARRNSSILPSARTAIRCDRRTPVRGSRTPRRLPSS